MENDISNARTTNLDTQVSDYSVDTHTFDSPADQKENYYDISKFTTWLGYYMEHPELKQAINALAIWSTGLGFEVKGEKNKYGLENVTGWGNDTINDILFNMFVMKKVAGDSFAEIVRNENGKLVNLRPLNPQYMRIVTNKKGRIKRYEYRIPLNKGKSNTTNYQPADILHFCNDRLGDQIHGTPVPQTVEWIIAARKEAMDDWRRISHRSTIRVLYVDIEDTTKLNTLRDQYKDGIKNGEVLILPAKKGDAEFEDLDLPPVQSFLQWIQYLENFFYQAVGIPRVIATSENYTEAASKVGFMTFEPIYTHEQVLIEQDIYNQLGIEIKFNRPPSLTSTMQSDEQKNTGQTSIQPNETQVTPQRNE